MLQSFLNFFRKPAQSQPWHVYAEHMKRLGVTQTALFLSFDCDTDLDAEAALSLLPLLEQRGIKASFAVPGTQLLRQKNAYKEVASRGYEFFNHGMRPHAEWDGQKYVGRTFYNELTLQEVENDIREADTTLREVLGITPHGFRAPHFGCYQEQEQVAFMHAVCADLGYTYASTTIPAYALERGPAFISQNIVELPLLGSWNNPTSILDSWTYLADRVHYRLSEEYVTLFSETIAASTKQHVPLLLSLYVDPAHVLGQAPFMRMLDMVRELRIPSYTGKECAQFFRGRLEGTCAA